MISHPNLKRNIPETRKQRLFRLFHILIIQYKISQYFFALLVAISALQMVYFSIHPSCQLVLGINSMQIVQKIFGFIEGSLIWQGSQQSVLIAAHSVFIVVYAFAIGIIIYEIRNIGSDSFSFRSNFHEFEIRYLQYLSALSRSVFVIPIVSLITISITKSLKLSNFLQIVIIPLSIILFLLYFSMLFLFSQLFIDNSPFSKFSLAGHIGSNERIRIILKAGMAIVCSLFPNQCQESRKTANLVILVVLMVGLLYLCYKSYSEPNLVNNFIRMVYEHSNVSLLVVYFVVLIQKILQTNQKITLIFLFVFCLFSNFTWVKIKQRRENLLLCSIYKTLTSKTQILSYNYYMCQYIRDLHQNPLYLVKLQGILSNHIFNCKKLDEVCKCRLNKSALKSFGYCPDNKNSSSQMRIWFQFVKNNLIYNTQKMNHLAEFHLLLSYIQKFVYNNSFLSYANLQKCSTKQRNLSVQFLIYHQKRIIQRTLDEEDIKNNQKKQVDTNNFLRMQNQIQHFQEEILKSSMQHLQFWTNLSQKGKKNKSLIMKQGNGLLVTVKKCQQLYNTINKKYPNNLQSIAIFSNYSKYVLNNQQLIVKNKTLYNQIKKRLCRSIKVSSQHQKQKYSENSITGSIIISAQKKNLGIIKSCSSKVTKILKFVSYQLVGQNINSLMPNFLGNIHNQILLKYLQKAQPETNFMQRCIPMLDKNNFMVFCRIMTKPLPSLLNGLQIIGIFQRIKQYHIRHSNQTPKYMLYRCDTGNIEALSQSFYSYYGYRLTKVNEYSEISEQLNLTSIFNDIHDSEIVSNQEGLQYQLKLRKGHKKTVKVKLYLVQQLNFFGIKSKLLNVFNCTQSNCNTMMLQNTLCINPQPSNLIVSQRSSQINAQTPNQNQNKDTKKKNTSVLTQQQLKQLEDTVPLKYKIFQILLLIFGVFIVVLSIVQFYFNLNKISVMTSFQQHNQYASNSLVYLTNVAYYSRLMHLSAIYPTDLPYFKQFKNNVSIYTQNLQKTQFWLVNKEVQYNSFLNFNFNEEVISWQINEKSAIVPTSSNLNLAIFDLVTSSASFGSSSQSNFNFPFQLASDSLSSKTNQYFRNFFRIRYSTAYSLIQTKLKYSAQLMETYKTKINNFLTNSYIQFSISSLVIVVFVCIQLRILYILLKYLFILTSLFNWLTKSEIEKEIHKCQNFLQHFFLNHYEVVFKLNKTQILRGNSFGESDKFVSKNLSQNLLMKTDYHTMVDKSSTFIQKANNSQYREVGTQNNILQQGKAINDEIDLIQLSQKYLLKQNQDKKKQKNQVSNNEQKQLLKKQEENEQIYLNEEQAQESCYKISINAFLPVIFGFVFLYTHFIGMFLFSVESDNRLTMYIETQNLIYQNIQALDILKYYGLEYSLDNSNFRNYSKLGTYYQNYIQNAFNFQKQMNMLTSKTEIQFRTKSLIEKLNLEGICYNSFIQFHSFKIQSFSASQCQSIDNSILNQSLRGSIVALIQNIINTTKMGSTLALVKSQSFTLIQKLDKYIQSSLLQIAYANKQEIVQNLQTETIITSVQFSFFIIALIVIILLVNWLVNKDLKNRILGTYQIISLIPQRIYQKNTNLCTEYRKNVKLLLE